MVKKLRNKLILGGVAIVAGFMVLKTMFFYVLLAGAAFGSFKYLTRKKS